MDKTRRTPRPPTTAGEWRARHAADPRVAAARARVAAARPPLTPEQIAILRPIFRPVRHLLRPQAAPKPGRTTQ